MSDFPLLETIDWPDDLRALALDQLPQVADELRRFILKSVSNTGGHLSSNLGTVELTVALHYVFNTPEDRIVWDVGHQTYAHKIITGRRRRMGQLRMKEGLSGFPRRVESSYDAFGTAHSSTSISAALGMAEAARLKQETRISIAVIGDGALSGGMAFEAMNNAGISKSNILLILNDNEMSISPAVGALHKYLVRLLSSSMYRAAWRASKKILGSKSGLIELALRAEEHLKGMITPGSTLFEELGFNYLGPVDGHDLPLLLGTLSSIKTAMQDRSQSTPQMLHIITKKGQGYKLAEHDPVLYHGVAKFNAETGLNQKKASSPPPTVPTPVLTYTEVFSQWLCDMAEKDDRLVAITPAMREGSGLVRFAKEYPQRYFDVGIAEQHALTFAAGLACEGLKPVVAIYSTFLQRAYDQLIHDVLVQDLPILFAIDRAGLVGADGATHMGSFDLTFLTCIPNIVVMAPSDENECWQMLYTGFLHEGAAAIRYPRGRGPGIIPETTMQALPMGKALLCRTGQKIVFFSFGSMLSSARQAAEALDATVFNMRFVKPIDRQTIIEAAKTHDCIVTLEENVVIGGAGSEVSRVLAEAQLLRPILHIGLPDRFIDQADPKEQWAECEMDAVSVTQRVRSWVDNLTLSA